MFNLDKLLASRKMQSVELAEKLECTVQTVSRIKNGKIRALRIDRICEVFDCQPGDLLEYLSDEEAEKRYGETFLEEYKKYHNQ